MFIIQNEGINHGTNEKRIGDGYKYIFQLKVDQPLTHVPYECWKDEKGFQGLKKPAEKFKNKSWKQLSRRKWLRENSSKKKMYRLPEEEQNANKNKNKNVTNDPGFDSLQLKYKIDELDDKIAEDYCWDDGDINDDGTETMEQRSQRKRQTVSELMFGQYHYRRQNNFCKQMAKDISNTFKVLIWKELIFKAPEKAWISFFFNGGCHIMYRWVFSKLRLKHFDFNDDEGLFKMYIFYI